MGIRVTAMNGRFPGLFLQLPEDFSLLFFWFCTCPCLFSEWPKRGRGAAGGEGTALLFFFETVFVDFFSKTFCFADAAERRKVELFFKKKKSFFLFLRQNGKSCSMSSEAMKPGFLQALDRFSGV